MASRGLHHVTLIAGPARRHFEFYRGVLGLRLVKKTVNFDDPGAYHLYWGSELGEPGTIVTFFPWPDAAPGRMGVGETEETAFQVPEAALGFWLQRFLEKGVAHEPLAKRFGESVLAFRDPDGARLALVGKRSLAGAPSAASAEIAPDMAIHGLHGVTLLLERADATAAVLSGALGFTETGREGATRRFRVAGAPVGAVVDLREVGGFPRGVQGAGSVHHVAFRAADEADQAAMAARLVSDHLGHPTEVKDRNYFRSIYFREPGRVLFEIATDPPGFAVDEAPDHLGQALKLPSGLEPYRSGIEAALPALD